VFEGLRLQIILLSLAVLFGVFIGYSFYLFYLSYYGRFELINQIL